eukprot:m.25956 g.25956  ORF g.25956 m.25956 type:complete len:1102 (-) comp7753_c0_seq2:141-3446(-)
MEQLIADMELAVLKMMAPPTTVSALERNQAEEYLVSFKQSQQPYSACQHLLVGSKEMYVHFHAAATFTAAIMREWSELSAQTRQELRTWLLSYTVEHPNVNHAVREQLVRSIAVIFKRAWVDEEESSRDQLFSQLGELFRLKTFHHMIGLSLLGAVLIEFSSNPDSVNMGMSVEKHMEAKKSFENNGLKQCFVMIMNQLKVYKNGTQENSIQLLDSSLSVCDQILSWTFTDYQCDNGNEDEASAQRFRGDQAWQELLLQGPLQLMVELYRVVRGEERLAHKCQQCLMLLAGSGEVFRNLDYRLQFLNHFVVLISGLLGEIIPIALTVIAGSGIGAELLSLNMTLGRLVGSFGVENCMKLGADALNTILKSMLDITNLSFHLMSLGGDGDDGGVDGEGSSTDAVNEILEAWVTVLISLERLELEKAGIPWQDCAFQVLDLYCKARVIKAKNDALSTEELAEELDHDVRLYEKQLLAVSCIARLIPDRSLPILCEMTSISFGRLMESIMAQGEISFDTLAQLSEEAHWNILIFGMVITESEKDDENVIPLPIMKFCKKVEQSTTPDPVINLSQQLLFGLDTLTSTFETSNFDHVSSTIIADLVWWSARWAKAYLLFDESMYEDELALSVVEHFGRDANGASKGAVLAMQSCLKGSIQALIAWPGDPHVVPEALALLDALPTSKLKQQIIYNIDNFRNVVELFRNETSRIGQLPGPVQEHIALLLAKSSSGAPESERFGWLQHLLKSRCEQFLKIVETGQVQKHGAASEKATSFIYVMSGIARALDSSNSAHLFALFQPLLATIVRCVSLFPSLFEVRCSVVRLFTNLVENSNWLSEADNSSLCRASQAAYADFSKTGLKAGGATDIAEDKSNRFKVLLECLERVSKVAMFTTVQSESVVSVPLLLLHSLVGIPMLLSREMLDDPEVCLLYYDFMRVIFSSYSAQLYTSGDLLHGLLRTLEWSQSEFDESASRRGLDAIFNLATCHFERLQQGVSDVSIGQVLLKFQELIFQRLFLSSMSTSLQKSAVMAFFALVCCNAEHFQTQVNCLLANHNDDTAQRLKLGFHGLIHSDGLEFRLDRKNRQLFWKNFSTHCVPLRAVLRRK